MDGSPDIHDAIVVGASLAGCTTATLLARQGASVLLVDQRSDPEAFKVVCGHYIQSSALPTIRRLGLYEPMLEAGALLSPLKVYWQGDPVGPVPSETVEPSINLRRRKLDPLVRNIASGTPGVKLQMGVKLEALAEQNGCVTATFSGEAGESRASAKLLVGADGRDSSVAEIARFRTARAKNGRFNYSPFYSGPRHADFPATTGWFDGKQWSGIFPTDDGLTGYYLMPTHDRLPEFKADLEGACLRMIAELPGAPPVDELELAGPIVGRIDMTNQWRNPVKGNIALVGDAASSIDPLFGVGCGWAFQSGELLADAAGPALASGGRLGPALGAYRRRMLGRIYPHGLSIVGYSRGRSLSGFERFVLKRAARSPEVAAEFVGLATRNTSPLTLMTSPSRNLKLLRG